MDANAVMVLDSADDRDVFYGTTSNGIRNGQPFAKSLPQSRNGSIIVTTRDKDLAFRLTAPKHDRNRTVGSTHSAAAFIPPHRSDIRFSADLSLA